MRSANQVVEFLVITLVASAGTAAIISWGLELLGLFPFSVFGTIITLNNFIATAVLGPPLLRVLYPRVKRDGLLYPHLMREEDLPPVPPSRQHLAAVSIAVTALLWTAVGTAISIGLFGVPIGAGLGGSMPPSESEILLQLGVGTIAFTILVGASLASGERLSSIVR